MILIPRPKYLEKILSLINRDVMLILIGQRRVGKSYLLRLVKEYLEKNEPDANIVYINKEFDISGEISDARQLYDYADRRLPEGGRNYLLIDEVQDIDNYENALRSLHAQDRCQIIATGSNAYIFSSELSTRLAGRYIEIPIYNLSYREFLSFRNIPDSDENLLKFLKVGGLPGLTHFDIDDDNQLTDYLSGVYDTIMLRDVISREKIRNIRFIHNLSRYIADTAGKLFSLRNICNVMKTEGENITTSLTSSYMGFLSNAMLINEVHRYDIHGKRLLETLSKFYFSDHGLRNLLCGFKLLTGIEKVMENVVYLYLLQQGYKVNVGILRIGEVDFVATRNSNIIYVQVTYLLNSEDTIKREFGNLAAIKDNYPKYVVSMNPIVGDLDQYPGIRHVSLRQFLTSDI